jgi:hypothetical protein
LRDAEHGRELALGNASLRPRADVVDNVPGQLRVRAWKLIEQLARVEQLLFLRFADPSIAAPLVLRYDSRPRRWNGVAVSSSRPIAQLQM